MCSKYLKILICIFFTLSIFSCKPVKYFINKKYKPLSITDQQINAVDQNLKYVDSIKPSLGIYFNSNVITKYASKSIKKEVQNLSDSNIKIHSFEPKLSFGKQGIMIKAPFSLTVHKMNVKLKGKMEGLTAVSSSNDSVFLYHAFKTLKITSVEFTKKKPGIKNRAIALLIKPFLKHFVDNLNGLYLKKPDKIATNLNETLTMNPKEIFTGKDVEIEGTETHVKKRISQTSLLIDEEGILIMLELDSVPKTNKDFLVKKRKGGKKSELNKKFKRYKTKYKKQWLERFEPLKEKTQISLSVTKTEISETFNQMFSKGFVYTQKINMPKESFDSKLEVKRSDVDCQKVRTKFSYPSFRGDACDWSCMKTVTVGVCPLCSRVRVEDPVCLATRNACRVKREAERIAWQTARETARIAHQAKNELAVTACNVWREANNFLALGRVKGNVSASGNAKINFSQFYLNEQLSGVLIKNTGGINMLVDSKISLRPADLGNIFMCYTNYDKHTKSNLKATISSSFTGASIQHQLEGESLKLILNFNPISYDATIRPSPLKAMLEDIKFTAKCPIFSGILNVTVPAAAVLSFTKMIKVSPEVELLLRGATKSEYTISPIVKTFKPISFKFNEERVEKLHVLWNEKNIEFRNQK